MVGERKQTIKETYTTVVYYFTQRYRGRMDYRIRFERAAHQGYGEPPKYFFLYLSKPQLRKMIANLQRLLDEG